MFPSVEASLADALDGMYAADAGVDETPAEVKHLGTAEG